MPFAYIDHTVNSQLSDKPACLLNGLFKLMSQGSFAEITNQRFSLKYQTFRQLADAFISGSGLQSVHVLNV